MRAEGLYHRMVIRGHRAAIFETLIERINRERERAGRETERARVRRFSHFTKRDDEGVPRGSLFGRSSGKFNREGM